MPGQVRIHASVDVAELRKDLESVEQGLGRELTAVLREAGGTVVRAMPPFTPYDPQHDFARRDGLPHLRDTFAARATGGTTTIVTTHPGGPVHEYGGTIAPRGVDIHIKRSQMAHKALDAEATQIEQDLNRRLQRLVRAHGL